MIDDPVCLPARAVTTSRACPAGPWWAQLRGKGFVRRRRPSSPAAAFGLGGGRAVKPMPGRSRVAKRRRQFGRKPLPTRFRWAFSAKMPFSERRATAPRPMCRGLLLGSAAAVAAGLVDTLSTDTGGSVRYRPIFAGFTASGRAMDASLDGMMAQAPSSATTGWFARDAYLRAGLCGHVADEGGTPPRRLVSPGTRLASPRRRFGQRLPLLDRSPDWPASTMR